MRGLKIIPLFLILILLSYVGMLFVEANRQDVSIAFGNYQTPQAALGFVLLTSALAGMLFAGLFCILELVVLLMHNRGLKKKIKKLEKKLTQYEEEEKKQSGLLPASASSDLDDEEEPLDLNLEEPDPKTENLLESDDPKEDPASDKILEENKN